jgi:hypothetical protein
MTRGRVALMFVIAACGGKTPPAPQTIGHQVASVAPTTCSDVGVILRGRVDGGEDAGRAREAAIANACELGKWSPAVVECVASNRKPEGCLSELDLKQRTSYDEKLAEWTAQYGGSEYGGDDYGGDLVNDGAPAVACADAVAAPILYPPAPKLGAADGEWDRARRQNALAQLCETDAWEDEVRNCLAPDRGVQDQTCVAQMPAEARDHITAKLAEVDALAGKLEAARKKKPDCKKATAAHYSDARWKGKLAQVKGKDRTRMIAESRDRMSKACAVEKWDDTACACLFSGGGDDCFVAGAMPGIRWGFPAMGVVVTTGIPECDAWGAEVAKIVACDKFPQSARDAVQQAYEQATLMWIGTPKDQLASVAANCQQITDAVKQARASVGCP